MSVVGMQKVGVYNPTQRKGCEYNIMMNETPEQSEAWSMRL